MTWMDRGTSFIGPSLTRVKRLSTQQCHLAQELAQCRRSGAGQRRRSGAGQCPEEQQQRRTCPHHHRSVTVTTATERSPSPPPASGLTTADTAAVVPSVGAVCRRVWRYPGTLTAVPGDHSRHSRRPAACCRSGAPPADAPLAAPLTELHLVTVVIGHQSPAWCVRETVTNAADRPGSWHTRHGTGW